MEQIEAIGPARKGPMATQRQRSSSKRSVTKPAGTRRESGVTGKSRVSGARQVKVTGALMLGLAATSGLLWFLSPGPLLPEEWRTLSDTRPAARTLVAGNAAYAGVDSKYRAIFETRTPIDRGRWTRVEVFHSGTPGGNTKTLSDGQGSRAKAHFVICNGNGGADGEVQITGAWDEQLGAHEGAEASVIRICVIGQGRGGAGGQVLTANQQLRLEGVVRSLRDGLAIDRQAVRMVERR